MSKRILVPIDLGGCSHKSLLCPPKRKPPTGELIKALVENYRVRHGHVNEVFFVHGGLPTQEQINSCEDTNIRLSLSPKELSNPGAWRLIDSLKTQLSCVELEGLTFDNSILKMCKRGYDAREQIKTIQRLNKYSINFSYTIATGLPGATRDSLRHDMDAIVKFKPDRVRIYPTQAWKGSELAQRASLKRWSYNERQTLSDVREWLSFLESVDITVTRIGLQPKHDIPIEAVYGPNVDSLRMRVGYLQYFDRMAGAIASQGQFGNEEIVVNPKDLAMAKGIDNDNIRRLRARLGYSDIRLEVDERVSRGDVQIRRNRDDGI